MDLSPGTAEGERLGKPDASDNGQVVNPKASAAVSVMGTTWRKRWGGFDESHHPKSVVDSGQS